ncbi:carbohydrate ABC transporter substrate-binding protein [Nocardia uniformis]|uniref:Carbohydrate ABC transporter substrate-binding protein n=1 Tax=Nocardia uniformis TaxID=53432 RepID=A0A849BX78_9NOCA|nr:carbohydrate ABC transporter substrate-binding protein [Nocardia uniformis]
MGLTVPLLGACAPDALLGDRDKVRIAVPWSGFERQAFDTVVAGVRSGRPELRAVEVIPLGDDIDTAFAARGPSAPEIVMLPQVGRIRELLDDGYRLQQIDATLWTDHDGPRYSPQWQDLLVRGNAVYGLPFKYSLKSLVWYDRNTFAERGLGDPHSWTVSAWIGQMETLAATPVRLLALGAADGWVVTDFFENLLAAQSARAYADLESATGVRRWDRPETQAALFRLGELWGHPTAFSGGAPVALTRQFTDAIREVFEHRRAAMVVAPDFAEPIVRRSLSSARRSTDVVGIAPFPAATTGGLRPKIGAGDVMVLTERAGDAARDWLAALAAPDVSQPWITRYGGFLSPNLRTANRYPPLLASIAPELDSWSRFDLSDRISWGIGRLGLQRTLTDFLVDVAEGADRVGAAVGRALDRLTTLEERRPG